MSLVRVVTSVHAKKVKLPAPLGAWVAIHATGEVPTTGWTAIRLSPVFYIVQPADGIWDFDMIADPPAGIAGDVVLPVAASTMIEVPAWCKGIRVRAATNKMEALIDEVALSATAAAAAPPRIGAGLMSVTQTIASYEDSFQPTGRTKFDPWPHAEMKKLHHDLVLTVQGPDEAKIRNCINRAIAAGAIAAILAAVGTGGAALPAAISAFLTELTNCLGNGFSARVDDHSHWVYWWT